MSTKLGLRSVLTNPVHWALAVTKSVRDSVYQERHHDLGVRTAILVGEDRLARKRIWENMK